MEKVTGLIGLLAVIVTAVVATDRANAQDQVPDEKILRPYTSGAGPAGIFRYGRDAVNGYDVFGVIDPVYWRIRFYTVEDMKPGRSLSKRITERGDCLLPPTFRLWRIHEHEERVVLQSQPEVTLTQLTNQNSSFVHRKVVLAKDTASVRDAITGGVTDAERRPGKPCGGVKDFDAELPQFNPDQDSAMEIKGGEHKPLRFYRRHATSKTPSYMTQEIFLARPGQYLVSAQELEGASFGSTQLRHFLVTARITGGGEDRAGFITPVVTIVRKGSTPSSDRTMRLNLGLTRVKAGQKFAAITTVGEVLLIGGADKKNFKFFSCSFSQSPKAVNRCATGSDPWDATANQSDLGEQNYAGEKSKIGRWEEALAMVNRLYFVDAGPLDKERCKTVTPCDVGIGNHKWLPPMELRLAEGVRTRKGVPYGQSYADDGRPWKDEHAKSFVDTGTSKIKPTPLIRLEKGRAYLFGDIENDPKLIKADSVSVFGTDCSALVSQMWRRSRISTEKFIEKANKGEMQRVRSIGEATIDDAFVINVKHTLNHIVLFRETRPAGKYDSSRAILVLESGSSCGGMCFSFYDESFFQGWAIVRNGKGKREFEDIPMETADWNSYFAK